MKNVVKQEDAFGCAIACVAQITGRSYQDAKNLFRNPDYVANNGCGCIIMKNALMRAGFKYRFTKARSNNLELLSRTGTLVLIEPNEQYKFGHYLVKTNHGWMNSWVNCPFYPIRACLENELPGNAEWIIYPE